MSTESSERQCRGSDDCTIMADSGMVSSFTRNVDRLSKNVASKEKTSVHSRNGKDSSSSQSVKVSCLSVIRKNLENQGISDKASKIILASWRDSTKKQYSTYVKQWFRFCSKRKIDPLQPALNEVLDFLTVLFDKGLSYSTINCARSALSALGIMFNGVTVGSNATIIRFLKGVYNLRPSEPRYSETWDVSKVFNFLRKLSPVKYISLKDLTLKLVMLIVLSTACRTQSLFLLCLDNLVKGKDSYTLFYSGLLKQNRPGFNVHFVELFAYPPDRRLCVFTVLKEYLMRTAQARSNSQKLFISYVKPFKAVSRETISRWIKTVMSKSGINLKSYSSHSARSAVVSKAFHNLIPVECILRRAGWTSEKTFAKFYKKPIESDEQRFQRAVLST